MTIETNENSEIPEITDQQRKRSMVFAVISSIGAVISGNCIAGTVMPLVAIKLGASELFLGFLSFVIALPLFFYLFTMSAIERVGKRRILIGWFLGATICIIPFMLVPMMVKWGFSGRVCLGMILVASFLRTACAALGGTGWFPLLQDIVPSEKIGRFFGMLRTSWSTAALILLLLIAWFLGDDPGWWKFEVLFVVAFAATLMRALLIIPMSEKRPEGEKAVKQSIISRIREVWAIKSLRMVIIYIFIYNFAFVSTVPFKIKLVKNLGYSDGFVMAASAMFSAGAILTLRFWGKLADRFGNRAVFSISHVGMIVTTILWIVVDKNAFGAGLIIFLFLAGSVFTSGNGIAQTRYLFNATPNHKQNYMNIANTFAGVGAAFGPLVAGIFLRLTDGFELSSGALHLNNYHMLFILNGLLFIIPHMLRRKLRLRDEVPTAQVITIMTRSIRDIVGPFVNISGGSNSDNGK